jgi:hypothetical protein
MGEVDVFQIGSTHELYAHMNVNYVRLPSLPAFDEYGKVVDAIQQGKFFTTTGEVLLTETQIDEEKAGRIAVQTRIHHTFPLEMAEIVWGDGKQTYRKTIPLTETHSFGDFTFWGNADGANWTWARLAVWDVAGNGAFVNPVWRSRNPAAR